MSVTPPYTQVDYGELMNQISNSSLIGEDTLIVSFYVSSTAKRVFRFFFFLSEFVLIDQLCPR